MLELTSDAQVAAFSERPCYHSLREPTQHARSMLTMASHRTWLAKQRDGSVLRAKGERLGPLWR
jgi:hypothetical protein